MADIRKILIIFVVAVLFAVLVFSVIEAVYPSPKWEDFCNTMDSAPVKFVAPANCTDLAVPGDFQKDCSTRKGYVEFTEYDSKGCPHNYICNTCQHEFDAVRIEYEKYLFYISAFLSLISIFIGLYLPAKDNALNEWIGTGFMLGGVFSLFFGTMRSFSSLDRYARPVIIFIELCLIIFIAYRKIGNLRKDKK